MSNLIEPYIVNAIEQRVREGLGVREISRQLEIAYNTVLRYRSILLTTTPNLKCACGQSLGHQGWCNFRFANSTVRQRFIANWKPNRIYIHTGRKSIPKVKPLPLLRWPFLVQGHDLPPFMMEIERIIPKTLPEHIRADVCQEMAVSILSGEITEVQIPFVWKDFMKRIYKIHPGKYGPISLDQPIWGTEDLFLYDTIPGEDGRYIVLRGDLSPTY